MKIKVSRTYRTYRFIDKAPTIDAVRTMVQDEGLNNHQVSQISGVAGGTLAGWFDGDTRNPFDSTLTAVTSSLGYVRRDDLQRDGTVRVGYIKARAYNYQKEIERAADWLLKQNSGRRKPRATRRKKNGHA